MKLVFHTFDTKTEQTDTVEFDVVNIERDSPEYITLYGEELQEKVPYVVLDQELLESLRRLDTRS